MGRDGKPVPYDAFTVGPTNSNFPCYRASKNFKEIQPSTWGKGLLVTLRHVV